MLHRQKYLSSAVRSLMHSLDAACAACESLAKLSASDAHNLLRFELTAITHVLQAREQMKELTPADGAVTNQITLFLAVTDCLEGKPAAKDQSANHEGAGVRLIGGYIPAPTLIALATAMRDVLELCCTAFDEEPAPVVYRHAPVSEALVWATGPDTA
jgi:hypothetical protein